MGGAPVPDSSLGRRGSRGPTEIAARRGGWQAWEREKVGRPIRPH
jgi:hypothetical protein